MTERLFINKALGSLLITMGLILFLVSPSFAESVTLNLKAEARTLTMPDGKVVDMWGFFDVNDNGTMWSPLSIPAVMVAGDVFTINLTNNLPEPVSIILPGQTATEPNAMDPVMFTDGQGRQRVRSFTHEAAPNGGTATYVWAGLKAGSFVCQSGSHVAVQVSMGLYGAFRVDESNGVAYDNGAGTSYPYLNEVILLYSEVDPILNQQVAAGTYGTPGNLTSTIDYTPEYYLVNGRPFPAQSLLPAGNPGETVLLRFMNAGSESKFPVLNNQYMELLAEDGNLLPVPLRQVSLELAAGKTKDAIFTSPNAPGYISVHDRGLHLTNASLPSGGMISYLEVAAPPLERQTLTVNSSEGGNVWVNSMPGGLYCPDGNCTQDYNQGTEIGLTATPNPGSVFRGWSGGAFTGIGDLLITMDAPVTVTATFATKFATLGIFRNGTWALDSNNNRQWDKGVDSVQQFGVSTDIPVAGDWDGDGNTEMGAFRNGQWFLDVNGDGKYNLGDKNLFFGAAADIPLVGDWNGDGIDDIGVFRKGTWYLDDNGNGVWDPAGSADPDLVLPAGSFGLASDIPITGDWNGNGITEIGVFRKGAWYLDDNGNGAWDPAGSADPDMVVPAGFFGLASDTPITGDWNGDDVTDIGVFRGGAWYLDDGDRRWNSATDTAIPQGTFGLPTDIPVIGKW